VGTLYLCVRSGSASSYAAFTLPQPVLCTRYMHSAPDSIYCFRRADPTQGCIVFWVSRTGNDVLCRVNREKGHLTALPRNSTVSAGPFRPDTAMRNERCTKSKSSRPFASLSFTAQSYMLSRLQLVSPRLVATLVTPLPTQTCSRFSIIQRPLTTSQPLKMSSPYTVVATERMSIRPLLADSDHVG
jgi:hypothetical protein